MQVYLTCINRTGFLAVGTGLRMKRGLEKLKYRLEKRFAIESIRAVIISLYKRYIMFGILRSLFMANRIVQQLLDEQINAFIDSFCNSSYNLFFDEKSQKLIHPGEYGNYKENACKRLIKFLIPNRWDIGRGFIVNNAEEVSTECDLVIYEPQLSSLIQTPDMQRFFPVEVVAGVGEVKSTLTKTQFKNAIAKLSKVKQIRENMQHAAIVMRENNRVRTVPFCPQFNPSDQIFTFLICQKLKFSLKSIANEMEQLYGNIPYHHRHNLILSIEDRAILTYYDPSTSKQKTYPNMGGIKFVNALTKSKKNNPLAAFYWFATSIALGIDCATVFYPDLATYLENSFGSTTQIEAQLENEGSI